MNATLRFLLWTLLPFAALAARAVDWPEGYVTAENSTSPNNRLAVLVPPVDTNLDEPEVKDFLVDLQTHRVLGAIDRAHYINGANHRFLHTMWAPDSTLCIVEVDTRYSFSSFTSVEITKGGLHQTNLAERVNHDISAVIGRHSHGQEEDGGTWVYYRLGADRKVRVRALSSTDPKALRSEISAPALFQGTYDFKKAKWTVTDARSITADQSEALAATYDGLKEDSSDSEKVRATALDEQLNHLYQALKVVLPAERFAKLKEEQVGWLKKRDAAGSASRKNDLVAARIRELDAMAWGGVSE